MDCLTTKQRHKAMAANKGKDTKPELILRRWLWHSGYRYRKNYKKITGIPDIAFPKYKIAIFCDGDFWHGKNFSDKEFTTNKKYWDNKIKRNREHDLDVTIALRDAGWIVLRYWESDIEHDPERCCKTIIQELCKARQAIYK